MPFEMDDEFDNLPALDSAVLDAAVANAEKQHARSKRAEKKRARSKRRRSAAGSTAVRVLPQTKQPRRHVVAARRRKNGLEAVIDERMEQARERGECHRCLGMFREEKRDADWEARFRVLSHRLCTRCHMRAKQRTAAERSYEFAQFASLLARAMAAESEHAEEVHAACIAKAVRAVVCEKATRSMFKELDIPPIVWNTLERAFRERLRDTS